MAQGRRAPESVAPGYCESEGKKPKGWPREGEREGRELDVRGKARGRTREGEEPKGEREGESPDQGGVRWCKPDEDDGTATAGEWREW